MNALIELQKSLPDCVFTDSESLYSKSLDGLKISFLPQAVIMIQKPEQVGIVLKLANQYKVPVTTRGVGSTLTGSATPTSDDTWVLDLSKLQNFSVNTDTGMCHVEPGVVLKTLQDAVAESGWFYPPDPSSHKWCTLGGNISCNAGGLRCVKYGVTRDYVVALEGYLPSGDFVRWAKETKKFAAGYNMRDLWIGHEGTLGVITKATLKLIPQPETRATFLAAFPDEQAALETAFHITKERITPSIMEFLDRLSVKGAEKAIQRSIFEGMPNRSLLLLEVDGSPTHVKESSEKLRTILHSEAESFIEADDDEQAEMLWVARRNCSSAMFELGNSKLNEDIVVPLEKQRNLYKEISRLRDLYNIPIAVFGHAGDGNLHANIMYNRDNAEHCENAEKCVEALMKTVIALGGSISGEHGIGLAKTPFMEMQFSSVELQAMKSIKKALDPNNILNPGKIFERFEAWKHTPEKITLPWDHKRK